MQSDLIAHAIEKKYTSEEIRAIGNQVYQLRVHLESLSSIAHIHAQVMADLYREYQQAREKMFHANMRLAIRIAMRSRPQNMDVDDAQQGAFIGLWRAIDTYNPNTAAFSTYAVWWIRQSMYRESERAAIIHLPKSIRDSIRTLRSLETPIEQLSVEDVMRICSLSRQRAYTALMFSRESHRIASIAGSIDEDPEAQEVHNETDDVSDPEHLFLDAEQAEFRHNLVHELLTTLEQARHGKKQYTQHARLLRIKYRIGEQTAGTQRRKIEEIADEMGISKERVRQIQSEAMEWIRSYCLEHHINGNNQTMV